MQEPASCLFELTPFQNPASSSSQPPKRLPGSSSFNDRPSAGGLNPSRLGGNPADMAAAAVAAAQPAASNPHSKLVVTSLSWSATGQTIAASYGRCVVVGRVGVVPRGVCDQGDYGVRALGMCERGFTWASRVC